MQTMEVKLEAKVEKVGLELMGKIQIYHTLYHSLFYPDIC
jgi:hypothetical protein